MPWPKGRKRSTKVSSHGGKLMIVLRNRHVIWADVPLTMGPQVRAEIAKAMEDGKESVIHLAPYSEDSVRVEDIVHVKYVAPKAIEPKETT